MKIETQVSIQAPKEKVWQVITDIENSINTISGIEKIEILERPSEGFVGLKWRETRTLFGQTATEVMWITESVENEHYKTRAESHGAIYTTTLSLSEKDGGTLLTMAFDSQARTFMAKFMSVTMGFLFKNATKKALAQDLRDIRAAAENS